MVRKRIPLGHVSITEHGKSERKIPITNKREGLIQMLPNEVIPYSFTYDKKDHNTEEEEKAKNEFAGTDFSKKDTKYYLIIEYIYPGSPDLLMIEEEIKM